MLPSRLVNPRTRNFCDLREQPTHTQHMLRAFVHIQRKQRTHKFATLSYGKIAQKEKVASFQGTVHFSNWHSHGVSKLICYETKHQDKTLKLGWYWGQNCRTTATLYYKHWTVVRGQFEWYSPPSPKIHTSNRKAVQQFSKTQEQDASLVLQKKLSVSIRVVAAILHQKPAQALFLSLPYLISVRIQGPLISLVVSDYVFFQTFNFSYF